MANAYTRIALRIHASDLARIRHAARICCMPLAAFLRQAAMREAEIVVASAKAIELSPDESRRLLAALDEPFRPNDRLRAAVGDASRLVR